MTSGPDRAQELGIERTPQGSAPRNPNANRFAPVTASQPRPRLTQHAVVGLMVVLGVLIAASLLATLAIGVLMLPT